jgi:hypothetical protein
MIFFRTITVINSEILVSEKGRQAAEAANASPVGLAGIAGALSGQHTLKV